MGLSFRPNENAGDLCLFDSLMLASEGGQRDQMLSHYNTHSLPNSVGRAMAAGPGPENSAAMGPRLCKI